MTRLSSLGQGYSALVIGASGGIGSAIARLVEADPACGRLLRLSRRDHPSFDVGDEASVADAALRISAQTDGLDFVFNATGALVIDGAAPEKSIRAIDAASMAAQFRLNAIGPALLIKHFVPLLPKDRRALFATLSARVGSIGDNRLGGWISYRAAKTAQNQIVRTASIEIARTRPQAVLAALHPGTVETALSDPFAGNRERLTPERSAAMLLGLLDGLAADQSGGFFAYDGSPIVW
jgi:NAD(P)-dependent dehydrogenase (short-subunit alcohol dehydrogenase family)